jgi:hypothetical protein
MVRDCLHEKKNTFNSYSVPPKIDCIADFVLNC